MLPRYITRFSGVSLVAYMLLGLISPVPATAVVETQDVPITCERTLSAPGPPGCTADDYCDFVAPALPAHAVLLGTGASLWMRARYAPPYQGIPCNACDIEPTCNPPCLQTTPNCACGVTWEKTEVSLCPPTSSGPCSSAIGTYCPGNCNLRPHDAQGAWPCGVHNCGSGEFGSSPESCVRASARRSCAGKLAPHC